MFYSNQIWGSEALLDEDESRHCIKVLRLKKEDQIQLVDGAGNLYEASIKTPDPKACRILVTGRLKNHLARDYTLHMAAAPTKSTDRFEWFIEKATEIGVDEITPLICERSERKKITMDRCRKILISAMKQSGRASLPKLNDPVDFNTLVRNPVNGRRLIAHCNAETEQYAGIFSTEIPDWLILIGPEGDFSPTEITRAREEHFIEISLGDAVFRTETAGIVACQIIAGLYRQPKTN